MRKNTAWHLISAAVRVQTTRRRICAETTMICWFMVMVQMSLRPEMRGVLLSDEIHAR